MISKKPLPTQASREEEDGARNYGWAQNAVRPSTKPLNFQDLSSHLSLHITARLLHNNGDKYYLVDGLSNVDITSAIAAGAKAGFSAGRWRNLSQGTRQQRLEKSDYARSRPSGIYLQPVRPRACKPPHELGRGKNILQNLNRLDNVRRLDSAIGVYQGVKAGAQLRGIHVAAKVVEVEYVLWAARQPAMPEQAKQFLRENLLIGVCQ